MKTYGGVEVQLRAFLTSAVDGGDWSVSCLSCFTPSTHWIGGWVILRISLDSVAKRKIHCTYQELNPGCSVLTIVTILAELLQLQF